MGRKPYIRLQLVLILAWVLTGCNSVASDTDLCSYSSTPSHAGCFLSADSPSDGLCSFHLITYTDTARIEGLCNSGESSFGFGGINMVLNYRDGMAVYAFDPYCRIAFYLEGNKLRVWQWGDPIDCGQSHSVTLDGTYYIRPNVTPAPIGCMGGDDPCGLASTAIP